MSHIRTITLLLAGAALMLSSLPAHACSCSWAGPFLNVAPGTPLIIRAKVVGHSMRSRDVDLAMDVEVLEVVWARVEGGNVTGRLTSRTPPGVNDIPERMSLKELKERLNARVR